MPKEVACWACGRGLEPGEGQLQELKRMKMRVSKTVYDEDTAPRDLASLTRRLQELNREIATLEERARLEGRSNGSAGDKQASDLSEGWNPSEV